MAINHACIPFRDRYDRDFLILRTRASNLKLVNIYNDNENKFSGALQHGTDIEFSMHGGHYLNRSPLDAVSTQL